MQIDATPEIEVFVRLADERGDRTYSTEHRLPSRPDALTVRHLLDEAVEHFRLLHDEREPAAIGVHVAYVAEPAAS